MSQDDVAVRVKYLLRGVRALGVGDALDHARCDLPASAHLQGAVTDVDVSGRKSQFLPLMFILNLQMRYLLDDVRIERRTCGIGVDRAHKDRSRNRDANIRN